MIMQSSRSNRGSIKKTRMLRSCVVMWETKNSWQIKRLGREAVRGGREERRNKEGKEGGSETNKQTKKGVEREGRKERRVDIKHRRAYLAMQWCH